MLDRTAFALKTILLQTLLWPALAYSADYVWIIGGGPTIASSQASIELNVKWIEDIFRRKAPEADLKIYYTDGNDPATDVIVWKPVDETADNLQPLARVYGAQTKNGNAYHSNTVPNVLGGTHVDTLTPQLSEAFSKLKAGDRVFFIYNGHGSFEGPDTSLNALRLWEESHLSAQALEGLISHIDAQVPVRMFFPQCFSGGFSHIVYPGARKGAQLANHNRCGFMAVSDDKEAEGCTASINIGDYRDYSTYFFGALDGKARTGEGLDANPDRDADGVVTLREAHFYALVHADSTDSPRTTSEVYLDEWEPWYLRWNINRRQPDNLYGQLAQALAERLAIPRDWPQVAVHLNGLRRDLEQDLSLHHEQQEALIQSTRKLQKRIQTQLESQWPGAINPYTYSYRQFMLQDVAEAQTFIQNHPDYPALVAEQTQSFELVTEVLGLERRLAQLDKLMRLRRLAIVLNDFERWANAEQRAEYTSLVSCESSSAW